MKNFFPIALLMLVGTYIKAQSPDSTIAIGRYFLSTTYTFQGEELTLQGVSNVVAQNKEAYAHLQSARGYKAAGNLLGFAGGLVVGLQLAKLLTDDTSINKTMLLTGFGALAISIPINLQASHEARKGVKIYNAGLEPSQPKTSAFNLRMGYSGNGVKVVLSF